MAKPVITAQELQRTLQSIHFEEKSGRLVIFAKEDNKTIAGSLMFNNGELVSIRFPGKTDQAAIRFLMNADISMSQFTPSSSVLSKAPENLPPMAEVLHMLAQGQAGVTMPVSNETLTSNIKTPPAQLERAEPLNSLTSTANDNQLSAQVGAIFTELFGADGAERLDKIATKHSPTRDPKGFIRMCKRVVETTFGKVVADNKFSNLR